MGQNLRFSDTIARADGEGLVDFAAVLGEFGRGVVEPSFWEEGVGAGEVDF